MTKLTKILAMLLLAATCSFANWLGGTSEPENTKKIDGKVFYQITTPEELAWFAVQVNTGNATINAQLANDIVLWDTEVTDKSGTTRWKAIGDTSTRAFDGIFDGNGHKISGLYVNDTISISINVGRGLFGVLDTNGVVKNLNVDNAYVTVSWGNCGGLVGVSKGIVEGLSFNGKVVTPGFSYAGGIVGYVDGTATITNCTNNGTTTATVTSTDSPSYAGGIVGWANKKTIVSTCVNTGRVLSTTRYTGSETSSSTFYRIAYAGGIAGYSSSKIMDSYNLANVEAVATSKAKLYSNKYYVGGVAGYTSGTVQNVYSAADSIIGEATGGYSNVGRKGALFGLIASGATTQNAYFDSKVAGLSVAVAIDSSSANTVNVGGLSTANMQCDQFAWQLNSMAGSQENSKIWSRANGYPIFADANNFPTMRVTFDDDGASTRKYTNNKGIVSMPDDPEPASGYKFVSWVKENGDLFTGKQKVSADMTVSALFASSTEQKYVVSFEYPEGNEITALVTDENGLLESIPEAPAAEEGYYFKGWFDENLTLVDTKTVFTENTTVKALYGELLDLSFTVTFKNIDGTVLQSSTVQYGNVPVYAGDTPTLAATAPYSYTFAGWDATLIPVTGEATYTATYDATINKYTVQFLNYDNSVLQEELLAYGTMPTYKGENPSRESTVEFNYTFKGFDKTIASVVGAATYIAEYDSTPVTYEVVFKNGSEILKTQYVEYGKAATAPATPTREGYVFNGWDKSFTSVKSALVVNALFAAAPKHQLIVYVDGKVEISEDVYEGASYTLPSAAEKTGYKFEGWYDNKGNYLGQPGDVITISADISIEARYSVLSYTITFVDDNGAIIESGSVEFGTMPTAPADPFKASTAQYTYEFAGWTPAVSMVTGNVTYTASYNSVLNAYKVTFLDYDGTTLKSQNVKYGAAATAPAEPERDGYKFIGWDNEFDEIVMNLDVTAQYEKLSSSSSSRSDVKPESSSAGDKPASSSSAKDESSSSEKGDALIDVGVPHFTVSTVGRNIQIGSARIGSAYAVVDMQGRMLKSGRVNASNFNVVMSSAGTFLVRVGSQTRKVNIK